MPHQWYKWLVLISGGKIPPRSFPPDGTTFSQISLGQKLSKDIPPYSYWNMQFYQSEAAYVKFDYSIPRGASIGVYARRNALPTHTQYHILDVLSGFKARSKRGSHVSKCINMYHLQFKCCMYSMYMCVLYSMCYKLFLAWGTFHILNIWGVSLALYMI